MKSSTGRTPLIRAAQYGNISVVEYLLTQNIYLEDVDSVCHEIMYRYAYTYIFMYMHTFMNINLYIQYIYVYTYVEI
jgi:ankyrin repeat protein